MLEPTTTTTGLLSPPVTTASTTTFINDVRSALLRDFKKESLLKNSTRTLTSEAEALLHHRFAKDWDHQSLSLSIPSQLHGQSSHISPRLGPNFLSPNPVELDFGDNTLDWVSSLYNKLPTCETSITDHSEERLDYQLHPKEIDFFGISRFSLSDGNNNNNSQDDDESSDNLGGKEENQNRTMSCSECGFIASNRKQLWRHGKRENHITRSSSKSIAGGNKPFKDKTEHSCDLCSYTSKSRFNVLRHFQRLHVNEKSTSCEQCDKQFKDLDTLKTHIRYTHNNERRYACDQCGKQFVSSSDLQRHRRIVHEKIRDFKCQKCGKSFQTSTNAKRHFLEVCSGGGGGDSTASHLVHRDTLNNTTSSFTIFKVTPASSFLPTYVQLPSYETE